MHELHRDARIALSLVCMLVYAQHTMHTMQVRPPKRTSEPGDLWPSRSNRRDLWSLRYLIRVNMWPHQPTILPSHFHEYPPTLQPVYLPQRSDPRDVHQGDEEIRPDQPKDNDKAMTCDSFENVDISDNWEHKFQMPTYLIKPWDSRTHILVIFLM